MAGVTAPNAPPVANIDMSNGTSADEGQAFLLDASGSTDADGDTLTYSWRQIAGPLAALSDANTAIASATMPVVNSDTILTFEVSVSDGTDTVRSTIDVTATNIVLSPTLNVLGERVGGLTGLHNPRNVALFSPSSSAGRVGITGIVDVAGGLQFFNYEADTGSFNFSASSPVNLTGAPGSEVFRSRFGLSPYFDELVTVPSESTVNYLSSRVSPGRYVSWAETQTSGTPCAVAPMATDEPGIVVGSDQGLVYTPINYDSVFVEFDAPVTIAGAGRHCAVATVEDQRIIYAFNDGDGRLYAWQIAPGSTSATLRSSLDLQLAAGYGVTGISKFNVPDHQENYLAISVTNGEHEANHQLRIYREWNGSLQHFTTLSWAKGVPGQMQYFFDARTGAWEIFGKLGGVPYVIFFDMEVPFFDPSLPDVPDPEFSIQGYADVGASIDEIALVRDYFPSGRGYVLTNREAGSVHVVRRNN